MYFPADLVDKRTGENWKKEYREGGQPPCDESAREGEEVLHSADRAEGVGAAVDRLRNPWVGGAGMGSADAER